jgi:predicted nucleotidyltransferase
MTDDLDATLAAWADKHPEILSLFVFGSRARGSARPDSDLDLAFELDDSRETQLTVLVVNRGQWQRELSTLTGLVVRDLYLWGDPEASGPAKQVYWRGMNNRDSLRIDVTSLRAVNGYWYYRDKTVAEEKAVSERGAATEILMAAGFSIERLVSCEDPNAPPDCEAKVDGIHAGIEVTELVHRESLELSIHSLRQPTGDGTTWWFPWDQQAFADAIQRIIGKKEEDGLRWQGGPYGRRLLVVHTDEPRLNRDTVARFLDGARFNASFFSDAVLGLSYDPTTETCPTFHLSLDRP